MPNYSSWVSIREYSRRKITLNNRAGGHYSVISDLASRKYQCTAANPHIGTDADGCQFGRVRGVYAMMIRVIHCCEITDERVAADFDAGMGDDRGALIDEYSFSYAKLCPGSSRTKFTGQDPSADSEAFTDCDLPRAVQHGKSSVTRDDR